MKKVTLLLFVIFPVLFFSCLSEDTDGCPARQYLLFSHSSTYAPESDFDNTIGNDVLLCVYQDKKLKYTEQISYDLINYRKVYSYRKRYGGDIDIVAWAVKSGSADSTPEWNLDEDLNAKFVEAEADMRTLSVKPFADELYLGMISLEGDDIMNETSHEIMMKNCASKILVIVEDPDGFFQDPGKELSVRIDGVMSKMNLHFEGIGEEAAVYKGLTEDPASDAAYSTGYFSTLPSSASQTVKATLYYGDAKVVSINTNERAISGERIIIRIAVGTSVSVEINGWEIKNIGVEWM